jgi:DNA-binding PucR family transcriptional regulator
VHAAIGTVARLYIHYNTMKHRMGRIVELLDVDLHDRASACRRRSPSPRAR